MSGKLINNYILSKLCENHIDILAVCGGVGKHKINFGLIGGLYQIYSVFEISPIWLRVGPTWAEFLSTLYLLLNKRVRRCITP